MLCSLTILCCAHIITSITCGQKSAVLCLILEGYHLRSQDNKNAHVSLHFQVFSRYPLTKTKAYAIALGTLSLQPLPLKFSFHSEDHKNLLYINKNCGDIFTFMISLSHLWAPSPQPFKTYAVHVDFIASHSETLFWTTSVKCQVITRNSEVIRDL